MTPRGGCVHFLRVLCRGVGGAGPLGRREIPNSGVSPLRVGHIVVSSEDPAAQPSQFVQLVG